VDGVMAHQARPFTFRRSFRFGFAGASFFLKTA
jgi:hypothetical protein